VEPYLHYHMSLCIDNQAQCHCLKSEVRLNNEQMLLPTSQKTQFASITKGKHFVSFGNKIIVYFVSNGAHKYRRGQSVDSRILEQVVHIVTAALYIFCLRRHICVLSPSKCSLGYQPLSQYRRFEA
jgi:hypothetical protein